MKQINSKLGKGIRFPGTTDMFMSILRKNLVWPNSFLVGRRKQLPQALSEPHTGLHPRKGAVLGMLLFHVQPHGVAVGVGRGQSKIRRVVHGLNQESCSSLCRPQGGTHRFSGCMAAEGPLCRALSHTDWLKHPLPPQGQTADCRHRGKTQARSCNVTKLP